MPKFLIVATLLALAAAAQAQTKKEWVQKVLAAQQPGIEATGQQLAEQSALALLQRASLALRGVAADQREAVAKDIAADAKAFTDETVPVLRKRAVEVAPATIGPLLEQKFSEKELEQLHALLTSPLYRKYQQLGGDMQRALLPALMKESRATLEPKLRDLEQRIGQRLKAAPKAPAASAPAARK